MQPALVVTAATENIGYEFFVSRSCFHVGSLILNLTRAELILQPFPSKTLTRSFSSTPLPISTEFVAPCYL